MSHWKLYHITTPKLTVLVAFNEQNELSNSHYITRGVKIIFNKALLRVLTYKYYDNFTKNCFPYVQRKLREGRFLFAKAKDTREYYRKHGN